MPKSMQETSKPVESFYKSLFEPNRRYLPGSTISNAPENNSFTVSLMHLELRRERKEDEMEVGESKVGIGLQES